VVQSPQKAWPHLPKKPQCIRSIHIGTVTTSSGLLQVARVGRNNQRALRRYEHLHPVQCATLIAPYVLWPFFDGNYQEYEADKRKRLGEEGTKPKRIRYKPISR